MVVWGCRCHLYCPTCETTFSLADEKLYEEIRDKGTCPICCGSLEDKTEPKKSDWDEEW